MMKVQKVLFAVLCALLVLVILLTGIVVGRVVDMFQSITAPGTSNPSTTEPIASQTKPTVPPEPTVPSTTVPSTSVPPETTEPPTTQPTEPGHVHEWVLTQTVEVTCENYGYKIYTCRGCGKQDIPFDEQVDPLGHSFGPGKTVAPTCTEEGYTSYTCSYCKKTEKRNIKAAKGHDFQMTESVTGTCDVAGYDRYICTHCGEEEKRNETVALGHDYVLTESDCTSATYTCSICGGQKVEELAEAGHNYVQFRIIKEASCTEDGEQEMICTRCAYVLLEIIPGGHHYELVDQGGSCTEGSWKLFQCSVCSDEKMETIQASGHVFTEWDYNSASGLLERSCLVCDLVQTSEELKITHVHTNAEGTNEQIYMIFVGTEEEPSLFSFTVHDKLNNGSVKYQVLPSVGLMVTYRNSAGELLGKNCRFLDRNRLITIEADTPATEPTQPETTEPTVTDPSEPTVTDPTDPSEPETTNPTDPTET